MHLLLTGGHLTPALALIHAAQKHQVTLSFIGRTHTRDDVKSQEPATLTPLGVNFIPLETPKFDRYRPFMSIIKLPRLFGSFLAARQILISTHLDLVVSFGGYLSLPVCIAAYSLKIPFVIHEQTIAIGLANQLLAPFAAKVCLSFPHSRRYLKFATPTVTGNLIRFEFFQPHLKRPSWLSPSNLPLIYITGGNQGSFFLNQTIEPLISTLSRQFQIVHQTGPTYPPKSAENYHSRTWLNADETAFILKTASLVVSRAGANTVAEIIASKTPAILIPLPRTHHDEQVKNAQLIQHAQAGVIISQSALSGQNLLAAITKVHQNASTYKKNYNVLQKYIHPEAPENFLQLCQSLVTPH